MVKTSYCRLCGRASGDGHEPWCSSNDDITVRPGNTREINADM